MPLRKILFLFFCGFILSACDDGEDLGTCTITRSGGNLVIEVTLEECQNRFLNEPGATGWGWAPNN